MNNKQKLHCLLEGRQTFKPLDFPWALEAFETQNKMHWLPEEVSLYTDLEEFNRSLNDYERKVLTKILLLFTQTDVEVAKVYLDYYLPVFKAPEIRMMLTSFANMEGIHVWGYDYLTRSLKLPENIYQEFLKYKSMSDKYDFMQEFNIDNPFNVALTLGIVSGFVEGVILYSSFAVLLAFSNIRENKMGKNCLNGMGQIVSFSIRDETLHCLSVMKLQKEYIKLQGDQIDKNLLEQKIHENARLIYDMEHAFIEECFSEGDLPYLTKQELYDFTKYLIDLRIEQMGMKPIFNQTENPLPWMHNILFAKELSNFFESTPTNYTKSNFINSNNMFDDM